MIPYRSEEGIIRNLRDAGCDEDTVQAFMEDFRHGRRTKGSRRLQRHRCGLLENLHTCQKRIDCLDYLLYMLREQDGQAK